MNIICVLIPKYVDNQQLCESLIVRNCKEMFFWFYFTEQNVLGFHSEVPHHIWS